MIEPRILVLDIETAPLEAYIWRLGDQTVTLDQLTTDWSILSYCAMWLDDRKIIYEDTGGRGAKKVRDDRKLMKGLHSLLDEASIVIAQNGKAFDIKKINARLIMHKFKPYSPIRVVDTLLAARAVFGFTSNKLAYLSTRVVNNPKSEHKKFPGLELWKECLKDNPAAWREMRRYNPQDVKATADVYREMLPWIPNHPNLGVYIGDKERRCPTCASKNIQRRGYEAKQNCVFASYRCMDCGKPSRGKTIELPMEVRRALLVG